MASTAGVNGWRSSRWRLLMWGAIAALLAIPAIAMQFTSEVDWGPEDFAFAGVLLIGAGLVFEVTARRALSAHLRLIVGAAIVGVVAVVWAEAAVGIF